MYDSQDPLHVIFEINKLILLLLIMFRVSCMKIDFTKQKLHLVITPLDMRLGFNCIYEITLVYLHIDVTKGNDYVVFISKSRRSAKIIGHDHKGSILIVRQLNQGRFEQLMGAAAGPAVKKLTAQELYLYLDGEDIEIKRTHLLKG